MRAQGESGSFTLLAKQGQTYSLKTGCVACDQDLVLHHWAVLVIWKSFAVKVLVSDCKNYGKLSSTGLKQQILPVTTYITGPLQVRLIQFEWGFTQNRIMSYFTEEGIYFTAHFQVNPWSCHSAELQSQRLCEMGIIVYLLFHTVIATNQTHVPFTSTEIFKCGWVLSQYRGRHIHTHIPFFLLYFLKFLNSYRYNRYKCNFIFLLSLHIVSTYHVPYLLQSNICNHISLIRNIRLLKW